MAESERIDRLEQKVIGLTDVVWTLIGWMAQSAASPINRQEASELLTKLGRINDL